MADNRCGSDDRDVWWRKKNIKDVVMSESENLMGKRDTRGKFWVRTEHIHGFCTGKGDTCKATNI